MSRAVKSSVVVFQYVRGGTLEDRLAAEGSLPVAEARRVLAAVADALAAAHRSGFVHRDVRPNNVLCDDDGRVLVSDFGLAGVLPEVHGSVSRLTGAGEVLGNLEYCSPEQLRGEEASEGSDVYALGVMGYRILAGEGPFGAARESDLMAAHLRAAFLARALRAAILARALRAEGHSVDTRATPARVAAWWTRILSLLKRRR